jgi:hypothetical protein
VAPRLAPLLVLAGLVALAGCQGPAAAPAPPPPAAVAAPDAPVEVAACPGCYEATTAWSDGALFVSSHTAEGFSVSRDGGRTFAAMPPPPAPPGAEGFAPRDVTLQADGQGRLWWTALMGFAAGVQDPPGVQVARSDDGGRTWATDVAVSLPRPLDPLADRQWLSVAPGGHAYLLCMCPFGTVPQLAHSGDDGASFGPLHPVTVGELGPYGSPAADGGGTVVVPYLVGAAGKTAVAVAVSTDHGTTFVPRVVAGPDADPSPCCTFPQAAWGAGRFALSWLQADGTVALSTSPDGMEWTTVTWGGKGAVAPWPAVQVRGPEVAMAWYESNASKVDLVVASGDAQAMGAERVRVPMDDVATDFAWFAWSPDGAIATAWTDGETLRSLVSHPS